MTMEEFTGKDVWDTASFFRISTELARKFWEGTAFYDPIADTFREQAALLKGDVAKHMAEIEKWITKEEDRIRGFPGYDGIEPFIASAQDTVKMMKEHMTIRQQKKESESITGILGQFEAMKERHPDAILLFRVGNTYQSFKEDAVKATAILGIEAKDKLVDSREVKATSFPHHALDTYLPRLVRAGMRVAICEQLEKPLQKKAGKSESQPNNEGSSEKWSDGMVSA